MSACPRCNGDGVVIIPDPDTGLTEKLTCALCQGTGESFIKPTKKKRRRFHKDMFRQGELFEQPVRHRR